MTDRGDGPARESRGRGRDAAHPGEIPVAGWKDVVYRLRRRLADHNLPITAAGVAFYAVIATFPALIGLIGMYGLVFDRAQATEQLSFLESQLQPDAVRLLLALVEGLAASDRFRMGLGIGGGALLTLWGASLGVRALMRALNVAYGEKEKRSFLIRNGVALLLTVGAVTVGSCIALAAVVPAILGEWLRPDPDVWRVVYQARWPAVALMFWLSLMLFYRYGPSRARARWSWVSWGALAGTAVWLAGSGILAWYVAGSRAIQHVYGSIGLVVLVLAWFLLSAYAVLIGAELNAELERQTARDTTVGAERPRGERGANAADSLGESSHRG